MSTSAVTPPPGFELERGEHLAVTPPPGFELEDQSGQDSVQLPTGFELEQPLQSDRVKSTGTQDGSIGSSRQSLPFQAAPVSQAESIKPQRPKRTARPTQPHPATAAPIRPYGSDSDAETLKFFNEALAKFSDSAQKPPSSPAAAATSTYRQLTPEEQAEIQRKNAAIRAREAEDNRIPDPADEDLSTDPFQIRGPVRTKAQEREEETKSIVPDSLMPTLAWIQSHVNDPLDRMGQAGGRFVGDMLEGGAAAILEGKEGYAEPGEAVDPESGLPLPRPEDYAAERVEEFRKGHPVLSGTLRGVGGVVGGTVADPRNWPFFFSGGLSGAVQRAISIGFTVQVAKNAYEAADQVQRIWDDPNIPLNQKYEAITNSVLGALMAGASASHIMRTEAPLPLEAHLVEQLNLMGEEAKRQIFSRLQDKLLPQTQEIRAGDKVTLKDGSKATLAHVTPEMGRAVVRTRMGRTKTIRLDEIQADGADAVAIEFVLAESPHPRQKATPSAEQIYKANASAALKPVTKEGPSWGFQRRTCGPVEYLFKGGGKQVQADGPITSDGLVLEAKHVEKPMKSPFVQSSGMKYNIRRLINRDLEGEFQRYAAVIRDPDTPIVGLKVITNDRRAVPYLLELMTKYGIPGRIVYK